MQRILAVVLVIVSMSACIPGSDSLEGELDEYVSLLNAQAEIVCDCWFEFGTESRSECVGSLSILPSQRRCFEDALDKSSEASIAVVSCWNRLRAEYNGCLDARLQCDDSISVDACEQDLDIGARDCPGLPTNVERALELCD